MEFPIDRSAARRAPPASLALAAAALVAALALASCGSGGGGGAGVPGLDDEFRLAHGRSVRLPSENLTIEFTDLVSDSRCPRDAQCPWEGEARILVTVAKAGAAPAVRELAIPSGENYRTPYLHYEVVLLGLDPPPTADGAPRESDYVATLVVTRGQD